MKLAQLEHWICILHAFQSFWILKQNKKKTEGRDFSACVGGKTDQRSMTDYFESPRDTGLTWGYPTKESAPTRGNVPGPKEQMDRLFTYFNFSILLKPCLNEFVLEKAHTLAFGHDCSLETGPEWMLHLETGTQFFLVNINRLCSQISNRTHIQKSSTKKQILAKFSVSLSRFNNISRNGYWRTRKRLFTHAATQADNLDFRLLDHKT